MKKLIVLATLAALPAVAMADVALSGNIGVNVQNVKTGKAGSVNDMASQEGDILFKGAEDLGNGLKAVWQVNQLFDTDRNSGAVTKGNTFVGLQGSFGEVRFGSVNNAPRTIGAVGLADLPTVFGVHTVTTSNAVYKSSRQRETDGIVFIAPAANGLTVAISHGLKTADRSKNSETAVGIKYDLSSALTLAYSSNSEKVATGGSNTQNEVNAAATFGDVGVNLGYAWNKTAAKKKQNGLALSGSYDIGATKLIAGYYKQSDSKTNGVKTVDGYKNYTLGVNYDLSKRTHVGFEWGKEDRKGSDNDVRGIATYIWHSF